MCKKCDRKEKIAKKISADQDKQPKRKGMSAETMKHIQSGNLGGFMRSHYPKD